MAYTLFYATLDLARILMDVFESTATGGSTTTIVDTLMYQTAGWFSDAPYGTAWLKLTTPASKIITGHTAGTITFTPAQSGAVAANDRYAAAPGIYPKAVLIQCINAALREMGKLPYQKDVTAVAAQESYTSSDDVAFGNEVYAVEFANSSSAPYHWTPHYRWTQKYVGSTLTLVFDEDTELQAAYKMRITYGSLHPEVWLDADVIHDLVAPDRLKWEAAVHALRWRYQRTKQDDPAQIALLNEAKEKVGAVAAETLPQAEAMRNAMRQAYPIERAKTGRHARW